MKLVTPPLFASTVSSKLHEDHLYFGGILFNAQQIILASSLKQLTCKSCTKKPYLLNQSIPSSHFPVNKIPANYDLISGCCSDYRTAVHMNLHLQ